MAGARTLTRARAAVALLLLSWLPASGAAQQAADPLRAELRLDGFAGGGASRDGGAGAPAIHAGAGVMRRVGFAQLGAAVGAGPSRDGLSAHLEAIGRFHVDPFRQQAWGLYGAAGGGARWVDGDSEPYLFFVIGIEGRRSAAGWSPAFELGLSRGLRAAAILRRTPAARR